VKVPYEWLREFVRTEIDPWELGHRLTMRGIEVEAIEEIRPSFQDVVVGKVLDVAAVPNSSNLSLCTVDVGRESLSIVCGASNVIAGCKVAVAPIGARLTGGLAIDEREIRGVTSQGMLCSERELGLSDDHSGIFLLPDDWRVGEAMERLPGISDAVFDINIPPNRGDLLSIYGIAREVGSVVNEKPILPRHKVPDNTPGDVADYVLLDVLDREGCPRYVLKMLRNVTMSASPFWMRQRITKCGMRSINAIVDVTNYIMLELGQPLHAFDYALLKGQRIEVRVADRETTFRTLDGVDRQLDSGDLLICDGAGPVAIAGIMGGENSEIRETTKDVALESAFFNPYYIRRTARRLGIKSEASLRFEKGIDISTTGMAAERAAALMAELTGAVIVGGKREVSEATVRKTIYVNFGRVNDLLGITVEPSTVTRALKSVDIEVVNRDERGALVAVPHFRHDLQEGADIVEEIARIYGYDYIPATMPVISLQAQKRDKKDRLLAEARQYLTGAGFFEAIDFAFFSARDVENFMIPDGDIRTSVVKIINPISKEYECMRTLIAPGLLRDIAYNLNRGERNIRFFEVGKTFFEMSDGLPTEHLSLCLVMTGKEREYFWREEPPECDYFDLKGVMEGLARIMHVAMTWERSEEPFLKKGRAADLYAHGEKVGWIGEMNDLVLKAYDIEQPVFCAELEFDIIVRKGNPDATHKPISRYPQVVRDFSFYVNETVALASLMEMIRGISPLVSSVDVFDVFKKDQTSVALRVVFQSFEDTLRDDEVNQLQDRIIKQLTGANGITLRV
jgi:phenylalanyl-tRNA synthetase beta chain